MRQVPRISFLFGGLLLAGSLGAQTSTVGNLLSAAAVNSSAGTSDVQTLIELSSPVNLAGNLNSATFFWSNSSCLASIKIKFFRPSGDILQFVTERGPFNSFPLTVALSPPVPVQAGDLIGVANLINSCGNPEGIGPGRAEGYVRFASDVTSNVSRASGQIFPNFTLGIFATGPAAPAVGSPVVSCPFSGSPGDQLAHGIVVPSYAGTNVRVVQLAYRASADGIYRITLQIRRGSFSGPLVGAAATAYVSLSASSATAVPVFFDFGGAPVTPGDTLTFIQTFSGPGALSFDVGGASCGGVAYETEGTTPPLDSFRNNGVGIAINQTARADLAGACIPSDTTLCIDSNSGDRRFRVTLNFGNAGGPSGVGQAIPMASLGVTNGGSFWFFSQNNPEMLLKVVNGCSFNNRLWVFATAATNVGFTLNVFDTSTGLMRTYTNPDNTAAQPVQDTSAFVCP